jgi:predicted ATPase
MQKLVIHKPFGPVQPTEIPIDDVLVFIGEQASGKSTVAKLVYFFKAIKRLLPEKLNREGNPSSTLDKFKQIIKEKFYELFDIKPHDSFKISYQYIEDRILTLAFDSQEGSLHVHFSNGLKKALELMENVYSEMLFLMAEDAFNTTGNLLFIPAGRNVTVSYDDMFKLNFYANLKNSKSSWKNIMLRFFERTEEVKFTFRGKSTAELIDRRKDLMGDVDEKVMAKANAIWEEILHGTYSSNGDGEKIHYGKGAEDYVFLDNAATGQQEVIRILQNIFLMILNKEKFYLIIEEPEAHLYPTAQHHLMEMVALMVNATGNQVLLTTHSPYVLTSFNNLLYAHKVGQSNASDVAKIIQKPLWLDPKKFNAYYLKRGRKDYCQSIFDRETGMIGYSKLDDVSEDIAGEFDQLLELHQSALHEKE